MGLNELLNVNNTFKEYIKANEGYDPNIYNDTKKIPTTGYGFNLKAEHIREQIPPDVLSGKRALKKQEAEVIFENVYTQSINDARQFVGNETFNSLGNEQKQVLIDMAYNMGLTRLNKFNNMRKALQSGDMKTARKELLDSKYATEDVPNRALKNADLLYKDEGSLYNLISEDAKLSPFKKAFAEARKAGKKTFEFNGKKYTTEVK